MTHQPWQTPFWPKGVAPEITDYKFPLFHLLDNSARKYPNNTFTIFAGASKTYAQVKDTADRIANFLFTKGIKKGTRLPYSFPIYPIFQKSFSGYLKPEQLQ